MDISIIEQKDVFLRLVLEKLKSAAVDFQETHQEIMRLNREGGRHREAGVVVLLHYQNSSGYVFQLIKRSKNVAQAGDISCPGGMLEDSTDNMLEHILLNTNMVRFVDGETLRNLPEKDEETSYLIRLFLMNALREAWEEIGLNPLNVDFLGALPAYSLTLFSRTIFPVVGVVKNPYQPRLSAEVETMLDVPLRFFFDPANYAMLEVLMESEKSEAFSAWKTPCLVLPDGKGNNEVLWGATFNILTNFLTIIAGDSFAMPSPQRVEQKILKQSYVGKFD